MKLFYKFLKIALTIFLIWVSFLLLSRPARVNLEKRVFYGVSHKRIVLSEPRRLVANVLEIDRFAPGLRVFITPAEMSGKFKALTTSEFLEKYHLKIALNGGYFKPQWAHHPLDYFPHSGDEVQTSSFGVSNGQSYSEFKTGFHALCIYDDLRMEIMNSLCPATALNAISGAEYLVKNGEVRDKGLDEKHPRSAIGFSEKLDKIWLVTIDGRQHFYSEGVYISELAEFMKSLGAEEALALDGGGSTTLVISNADGSPEVLNSPIQTGIYGRERPVANHIGFYLDSERISE